MADQAPQTPVPQTTTAQVPQLAIGDACPVPIVTDGFYSIRMMADLVRITMYSYMAAGNEPPKPVITHVITMTLPAFLKSADTVDKYLKSLEEAGAIKKTT